MSRLRDRVTETGARGELVLYRLDRPAEITCARCAGRSVTRGPGRRSGGYLVGLGSVTGAGRYRIECDVPVAQLPGWLAGLLAVTGRAMPAVHRGQRR